MVSTGYRSVALSERVLAQRHIYVSTDIQTVPRRDCKSAHARVRCDYRTTLSTRCAAFSCALLRGGSYNDCGRLEDTQRGLGTFLPFYGILDISGFCQILDHEFELIQG